jgi:hypothetical protein
MLKDSDIKGALQTDLIDELQLDDVHCTLRMGLKPRGLLVSGDNPRP